MDRHLLIPGLEHIKAEPNAELLKNVLLRKEIPKRVPFMELFLDGEVQAAIWGRMPATFEEKTELHMRLGYDTVSVGSGPMFTYARQTSEDMSPQLKRPERGWIMGNLGVIYNRQDFERYPWPEIDTTLPERLEMAAKSLPEGMGIVLQSSGVLENLMWIMSYEGLSCALFEDQQLVQDVSNRVGDLIYRSYEQCIGCDKVIGIFFGDDLGFKTQTLISPEHLRTYVFPWQKKLADLCHKYNKIFILHACGNLEGVMEDLIDYVGIDAKHSYEDAIEPVSSFKSRYGDRIGVVGGVDVDVLARGSVDDVSMYTRRVLEKCASSGGYALGSGNSVANYIPIENYFAMLREGWAYKAG